MNNWEGDMDFPDLLKGEILAKDLSRERNKSRRVKIQGWDDLIKVFDHFKKLDKIKKERWIFRGEKLSAIKEKESYDYEKNLVTKIEEVFDNFEIKDGRKRIKIENDLIRKFKRQIHQYMDISESEIKNIGNCLSFMRHYGAPTRFLDWTYSFFNAVYFAINRFKKGSNYVVWAINDTWLTEKASKILCKKFEEKGNEDLRNKFKKYYCEDKENFDFKNEELFAKTFLRDNPIEFIHAYNPLKLHKRLVSQRALFLCPGDITKPFKDILTGMFEEDENNTNFFMIEITEDKDNEENKVDMKEILYKLYELDVIGSNIFPDLQGFAESLATYVAFPEILSPQYEEFKELYKSCF